MLRGFGSPNVDSAGDGHIFYLFIPEFKTQNIAEKNTFRLSFLNGSFVNWCVALTGIVYIRTL